MTFHPGQKIVCIVDDWSHPLAHLVDQLPRKGTIYHVRGIAPALILDHPSCRFIWLCEIKNRLILDCLDCEPSFLADCFRPVVEKKTNISIFTAMLTPSGRELETVMTDDANPVRSPGLESEKPIPTGTPA